MSTPPTSRPTGDAAPLRPRPALFWSLLALYVVALGALVWMRLAR